MRPRNRVSSAGLDLVKRFEGYRRQAAQLPDGRWTIGYGHTLTAREGAIVAEPDAESLLLYDLHAAGKVVDEQVFTPLTQNQFDALCSFAFNIGADEFRRSDVLKRLNEGAMVQAGCAMEMWRKAEFEGEEIVVDALVRRRAAEKVLFLTPPDDAFVPAPTPVLRPRIDPNAEDLVPNEAPTELATSLYGASVIVTRGREPPKPEPEPELAPEPEPEPHPGPEWAFAPEPEVEAEPEFEPEAELEPEPLPEAEPAPRVTAAAEAVAARLETLFADTPEMESEPDEVIAEPIDDFGEMALEETAEEPSDRDAAEEAFFEAFIEAEEPEEVEADASDLTMTVEEPELEPQTITPIVMSYPATSAPGPSMFQPSFTSQPAAAPATEVTPPEPTFEPEFEPETELEEIVAEPVDEESPLEAAETVDADLWGDDDAFLEPAPGAPAVAADEPDELELAPAAEAPPAEIEAHEDEPAQPDVRMPDPTPPRASFTVENNAVRDFLPQRTQRPEPPREPGLLTDLFLLLIGIAFFGFAVFWALNADPAGPGVHPSYIAWGTGFVGISFVVVAMYRLLERLGDAADRD